MAVASATVLAIAGVSLTHDASAAVTPSFATSTPANVLSYLNSISGNHVLSGQHNRESNSNPAQWTTKVHDITGEYPAIWSGDFLYESDEIGLRQNLVNEAKSEWAAGSLVSLIWHACPPTTGSSCAWDTNGVLAHLSDAQWTQLTTSGTALNTAWKARLDEIVPYLQQLKDAGIPVLWRFLHEMNDGWSWWGGRSGAGGSAKLYQISHDYLVNTKGLTNLIWVWNLKDDDASQYSAYYPGSSYVDVVSLDPWVKNFPSATDYSTLQGIAGSKPLALAEVGTLPTVAQLTSQPKWTWFSDWSEYLTSNNSNTTIQNLYFNARVLHRGDVTLPGGGGGTTTPPTGSGTGNITGIGGKCVDVAAANSANGTAVQLYTCNGTNAQQWTNDVGSDGSLRALGKCLDVTASGTANGTAVQLYDCNGTDAQKWSSSSGRLINAGSGRCLDASGQSSADGTRLQIWDCTGNSNQSWTLPS
jgi:mannan endo-1,4-beta-mannosidase